MLLYDEVVSDNLTQILPCSSFFADLNPRYNPPSSARENKPEAINQYIV